MFDFSCNCFLSNPEVIIKSSIQLNTLLTTQESSGDHQISSTNEIIDTKSFQIINQQSLPHIPVHNEMILNTSIKPLYDFLYIVPEKAPLGTLYSQINSRYKINININNDNSSGTALYNIQYLAPNQIYKMYYARRNNKDLLEELHVTQNFKFILRIKSTNSNDSPQKSLQTQNIGSYTPNSKETKASNNQQSQYSLEIVQVYENDPDFYRENFDFELKLFALTPSNKLKQTNGQNQSPFQAPFKTNNNQIPSPKNNLQLQTKNINNQSMNGSNFESSHHSSLYQTNITDTLTHPNQKTNQISQSQSSYLGSLSTPQNNKSEQLNNPSTQQSSININNIKNDHHNHFNQNNHYNRNNHCIYNKNCKTNETFIINDSKSNDYATKMNHILNQKIEQEVGQSSINTSIQLQQTNKQNRLKFKGKTLYYNNEEVITRQKSKSAQKNQQFASMNQQKDSINEQSAQKNKVLNRNQAFIYNSGCSSNSINNIALINSSHGPSINKFFQSENSSQPYQLTNNIQYKSMKKSKTENTSNFSSQGEDQFAEQNKYSSNITNQNLSIISNQNPSFTEDKNQSSYCQQKSTKAINKSPLNKPKNSPLSKSNKTSSIAKSPQMKANQSFKFSYNSQSTTNSGYKQIQLLSENFPKALTDQNKKQQYQTPYLQLSNLKKSQQKQQFQTFNKSPLINKSNLMNKSSTIKNSFNQQNNLTANNTPTLNKTPKLLSSPQSTGQKFNLRFENEIKRLTIEQKVKDQEVELEQQLQRFPQMNMFVQSSTNQQINEMNNQIEKPDQFSSKNNCEQEEVNTPLEQKQLFTVEEANSPFETSINKFYTQKTSPSKYRITQPDVIQSNLIFIQYINFTTKKKYNRIDETDEFSNTQRTNSDYKKIKYYLKQLKQDQDSSSISSQNLKTYEYYQSSYLIPDYSKLSLNKSSQTNIQQLSQREKTIQYMIPVYEYKMEKLGFNLEYDAENKSIIISSKKNEGKNVNSSEKQLQQSVFKIDERIKTDQLTYYFEDICASIQYQTID